MQHHNIPWRPLNALSTWENTKDQSYHEPVLVFKHSTRCGISHMALERLEQQWADQPLAVQPVFLDLIAHRSIADQIAIDMGVLHQSPQILLICKGEAHFTTSHNAISVPVIANALDQLPVSS